VKKIPLLIGPPLNVLPNEMPMKLTYDRAREFERTIYGALIACPAQGFMQQDVPDVGAGAIVTIDRNRDLAQKMADEIGYLMFAHRKEYWNHLPDAAEAVAMAMKSDKAPVAISDGGDNIGAGTPGDGTELLRQILKQGVDSAFIMMWDPAAARTAAKSKVGDTVTLTMGGHSAPVYGPPVTITGTLAALIGAPDSSDISARIDMKGISVVVNTARRGPEDMRRPNELGIYPEKYRMTVCKGGFAFRTTYRPETYSYIVAETPGFASINVKGFKYTKIKRPIYPIDEI
jgi:microcystin degradation protein MlrC